MQRLPCWDGKLGRRRITPSVAAGSKAASMIVPMLIPKLTGDMHQLVHKTIPVPSWYAIEYYVTDGSTQYRKDNE